MPEGEISHAEMIAWLRAHRKWVEPHDTEMAEAVLAHLERTQPTDTQADLTERARLPTLEQFRTAREIVNDVVERCGAPIDEELQAILVDDIAAALQSEREAERAEARRAATLNRTAAEQIAAEIVSIMETHDQQEAERGYVDTPGGLEHMGDVWRLLGGWRDRLASPAPQEETR